MNKRKSDDIEPKKRKKTLGDKKVTHITGEKDWEYFDDCPICQAMKNGTADTLEGLVNAFKEAKKKGHRVYISDKFEKL